LVIFNNFVTSYTQLFLKVIIRPDHGFLMVKMPLNGALKSKDLSWITGGKPYQWAKRSLGIISDLQTLKRHERRNDARQV
jgi:hypothetical protein